MSNDKLIAEIHNNIVTLTDKVSKALTKIDNNDEKINNLVGSLINQNDRIGSLETTEAARVTRAEGVKKFVKIYVPGLCAVFGVVFGAWDSIADWISKIIVG